MWKVNERQWWTQSESDVSSGDLWSMLPMISYAYNFFWKKIYNYNFPFMFI
jgi:hypothetical protein